MGKQVSNGYRKRYLVTRAFKLEIRNICMRFICKYLYILIFTVLYSTVIKTMQVGDDRHHMSVLPFQGA